jgi:hypothetical protein
MRMPLYESDAVDDAKNPVISAPPYSVPGIICERCGKWGTSSRVRLPFSSALAAYFKERPFYPRDSWEAQQAQWAATLGIPPDRLEPGAELGPPIGILYQAIREDVVHASPGQMFVQERVASAIRESQLTGVELWQVQLAPASPGQSRSCASIEPDSRVEVGAAPVSLEEQVRNALLFELHVTGKAWRQGSALETLRLCKLCGRLGFPQPKYLSVDVERWDGSDFFHVDLNPNIVLVTARARDLFETQGFSNCDFVPV